MWKYRIARKQTALCELLHLQLFSPELGVWFSFGSSVTLSIPRLPSCQRLCWLSQAPGCYFLISRAEIKTKFDWAVLILLLHLDCALQTASHHTWSLSRVQLASHIVFDLKYKYNFIVCVIFCLFTTPSWLSWTFFFSSLLCIHTHTHLFNTL